MSKFMLIKNTSSKDVVVRIFPHVKIPAGESKVLDSKWEYIVEKYKDIQILKRGDSESEFLEKPKTPEAPKANTPKPQEKKAKASPSPNKKAPKKTSK